MKGFIEFLKERAVVGLAVGFVLGGAVSKLVTSIVNDLVSPIIGIFLGSTKGLAGAYISISGNRIMYGNFISVLIDFLTISAVVYFTVKALKIEKLTKKK